ncbi:hypothetical protein ATANTOWER_006439 [Ataeniobius toweri]|uniref:Uncharacterized protein n=1 Tax=Ataeniobius toweri TaxID=208326 RepID=A0ABU7BH19_9TELE|nr:hypothetical protein [Ataeniobius toweri]
MGGRRGTPWSGHQSIAENNTQTTKHRLIHTPKGNLERPINLTGMSLDCRRKPEYPERTHAYTWENMQSPCRKSPGQESNPGPSGCKATVLPNVSPCSPVQDCAHRNF